MPRSIGAVAVGYLVMFVLVFASFSGAYLAIGADGAFQPGTYQVSILWIVVSIVLGIVAALAGGFVCATIAPGGKAPMESWIWDVPHMEELMMGRSNVRVDFLKPALGAAGALAGAKLRKPGLSS